MWANRSSSLMPKIRSSRRKPTRAKWEISFVDILPAWSRVDDGMTETGLCRTDADENAARINMQSAKFGSGLKRLNEASPIRCQKHDPIDATFWGGIVLYIDIIYIFQ